MKVAQPGYENNVHTLLSNIMKVAQPGYEKQCKYITKQYYMKVAQPEYENNVNTLLSNIIWKSHNLDIKTM